MIQFWFNDYSELFNANNLAFVSGNKSENYVRVLNIIALLSIIVGFVMVAIKRKPVYFAMVVLVLSLTILINSNIRLPFTNIPSTLSNSYDTNVSLVKNSVAGTNNLFLNSLNNFNVGDIIALSVNGAILETNIISGISYTNETPVLVLLNNLKNTYIPNSTRILKVSDSSPNIIPPPDGNMSIQQSNNDFGTTDGNIMAAKRFPSFTLPSFNRYDWNLELSTYGGMQPGQLPSYQYQGPPYGPLECRKSNITNPMGTIDPTEYDEPPTMYGTCNVGEPTPDGRNEDYQMTNNQEATVSQRVDDLLFHRGNSQMVFTPMPVDTLPNDQEAFGHFLYRNPTNLVNAKYASIFVNDPEKYRLVSRLARATGTEGGSGNK